MPSSGCPASISISAAIRERAKSQGPFVSGRARRAASKSPRAMWSPVIFRRESSSVMEGSTG